MKAIRSLFTRPAPAEPPAEATVEPQSCWLPFSAESNGLHYCWRGWGPNERSNSLFVYECSNEQWCFKPTTGPAHPALAGGCSVCVGRCLVCIPLVVMKSLLTSMTCPSLISILSSGARFKPQVVNLLGRVTVDLSEWTRELCAALEDTVLPPHNQDQHSPGKLSYDESGWTNEIHLFDVQDSTFL